MFGTHAWLGFSWVVYCVLHSLLASMNVKRFFQKRLGRSFRHYRLGYTLFAFAGLAALLWFQLSLSSVKLYAPIFFTNVAGGLVGSCGLLIMGICIKKYFLNLSGLRSLAREEIYPVLEIKGVHRYVRHPLYAGTFLFIWGLLLLAPTLSLLLSNGIITAYTLLALRLEEKKLVLQFGEAYKTYQQTVPPIIPNF